MDNREFRVEAANPGRNTPGPFRWMFYPDPSKAALAESMSALNSGDVWTALGRRCTLGLKKWDF